MNFSFQSKLRLPSSDEAGFTLLEVLISIVLLVVISLAIYQATTETYRLRDILSNEGDFYNGIRLSMGVIERDVASIYNPALMLPPKTQPSGTPVAPTADAAREQEALTSGELGQQSQYWGSALDMTGLRPSRLIGTENKLSFISLSHLRVYKDSPESDFSKIAYELQSDKTGYGDKEGRVLVKTESPNAFGEDDGNLARDKMAHTYPLLYGIKTLRFRYWRKDKKQWNNSWDSEASDVKGMFPDIIEVTFEVVGPSRLRFDGNYHFRPEIPLNGLNPSY